MERRRWGHASSFGAIFIFFIYSCYYSIIIIMIDSCRRTTSLFFPQLSRRFSGGVSFTFWIMPWILGHDFNFLFFYFLCFNKGVRGTKQILNEASKPHPVSVQYIRWCHITFFLCIFSIIVIVTYCFLSFPSNSSKQWLTLFPKPTKLKPTPLHDLTMMIMIYTSIIFRVCRCRASNTASEAFASR